MSIQQPNLKLEKPFQLLTIEEAAELLRTPVSTLRYWRHMNKGPKAARIGGRIMYRQDDLESWIEQQFNQA
jgi:excisionase family DNA binding protein